MPHFAHTFGDDVQDWEPLEDHLRCVATTAEHFAGKFGAGEWGRLAGLWHDVGKYRQEFQLRLRDPSVSAPHAGIGAALSQSFLPTAFAIAGHHTGLPNREDSEHGPTPLKTTIAANLSLLTTIQEAIPEAIRIAESPTPPPWLVAAMKRCFRPGREDHHRPLEFFTRMLFSALVDADRLETAAFYARVHDQTPAQKLRTEPISTLQHRLDAFIDAKIARAAAHAPTPMNRLRARVLADCRTAAEQPPGLFSLTVPTGGGKTLAAMSFALQHADRHNLDRVIVVIPFTSIIEQNAKQYREALGEDSERPETWSVLEHHSGVDEKVREDENGEREARRKLTAENWDSPIVVTTTVQFFESLFSNHPGRCRKLHNIARSVVILDEVQSLPPALLHPILDGLSELTSHYGCSVVLSTATPPALAKREDFPKGLEGVRPIVDGFELAADPAARRVHVEWRTDQVTSYSELAEELRTHDQSLAIVHRRNDARTLAELLPPQGRFHLSALMCPAHRSATLNVIRQRLADGRRCRLVSTQLIEAGVDVDFPVVYRALAGVDSLAQSAGRCDREGRRTEAAGMPAGRMIVFLAETEPPAGLLRDAVQATKALLGMQGQDERLPEGLDLFNPRHAELFFELLYSGQVRDAKGIQTQRAALNFANVEFLFRMIDSSGKSVAVPWGTEGEARIEAFRREPSRETARALQPYLVQVNDRYFTTLVTAGQIELVGENLGLPTGLFRGLYSDEFGLQPTADGTIDPEILVVSV